MKNDKVNLIETIYGLSPMQEGMLFHKMMDETSLAYFEQSSMQIRGKFDVTNAEIALTLLSDKYDVLRTLFFYRKSTVAKQVVLKSRKPLFLVFDVSLEDTSNIKNLTEIMKLRDKKRQFDLEKDTLIRLTVVRYTSELFTLIWSFHHIIMDGWCLSLIFRDFLQIYNELCSGMNLESIRSKIISEKKDKKGYKDYINWLDKQDKQESIKYWSEVLVSYNHVAEIEYTEKIEKQDEETAMISCKLDNLFFEQLKQWVNKKGITINILIECAWGILLQYYTNSDDVVFGKVVSGRNAPISNIDEMVGLFINTIPCRIKKTPGMTISELVKNIKHQDNESMLHDYLSLTEIQNCCECKENLIKTLLVFENFYEDKEGLQKELNNLDSNLEIEFDEVKVQTNYDLSLRSYVGETLVFDLTYYTRKYSNSFVSQILDRLKLVLLQMVCCDSDKKIDDINLITTEERKMLQSFSFGLKRKKSSENILHLLKNQVELQPDKIAIEYGNQNITYQEFYRKVNSLAYILKNKQVGSDDIVAIISKKSIEMMIGIYSVISAGAAYVPIDPEYPIERIRYIMDDCSPKAILYYGNIITTDIYSIDLERTDLWENNSYIENTIKPNNLAYCIYTSGTTGAPKGVAIEHHSLINHVINAYESLYQGVVGRTPFFTNYCFDFSIPMTFVPLLFGGSVVLLDGLNDLEDKIAMGENYDLIKMTPSHFKALNVDRIKGRSIVRVVVFGGEELDLLTVKQVRECFPNVCIHNEYGPTEATVYTTQEIVNENEIMTIGKPVKNSQIYIMNNNSLCGIGIIGEIYIGGDGVAREYINNKKETLEKFVINSYGDGLLYKSGDLARWLSDGRIQFIGRKDNQVKINGYRIELNEIEKCIKKCEEIRECVVIPINVNQDEKSLIAYVVSDMQMNESIIKERISKYLPRYMVPSKFVQITAIPINKNGKLDVKRLPVIEAENKNQYIAPQNETEKLICSIFEQVLDKKDVGITENFFDIGGNSIKAIRAISKAHEYGLTIDIQELMKQQTPERIAKSYMDRKLLPAEIIDMVDIYKAEQSSKEIDPVYMNKVCQLFHTYDINIQNQKIINQKKSLIADQFILSNENYMRAFSISLQNKYSLSNVINSIKHIIKLQTALRTVYCSNENLICEFQYHDEWVIPVLNAESDQERYEWIQTFQIVNREEYFIARNKLLAKIGIIVIKPNQIEVCLFVHHAIWDGMSKNIFKKQLIDLLENNNLEISELDQSSVKQTDLNSSFYLEHVNEYKKNIKQAKKYLYTGKNKNCVIVRKYNIDCCMEYYQNPFMLAIKILKKLCNRIYGNRIETLPIALVHNGRNQKNKELLGMYLDLLPISINTLMSEEDCVKDALTKIEYLVENSIGLSNLIDNIGKLELLSLKKCTPIVNVSYGYDEMNNIDSDDKEQIMDYSSNSSLSLDIQVCKETFSIYITVPMQQKDEAIQIIDEVFDIN